MLLDQKWLIAGVTALFAVAGVLYALLSTPIYEADALVHVERRSTLAPMGEFGGMFGEGGGETRTAAEIQILQSRMVLDQVVNRVGLDTLVQPQRLPVVGDFLTRQGVQRPRIFQNSSWVWADEHLSIGRLEVAPHLRDRELILQMAEQGQYRLKLNGETVGTGEVGQLSSFMDGAIQLRVAEAQAGSGARFELRKRSIAAATRALRGRLSVTEVGGGRGGGTGILRLTITGPDREEIRTALDAVAETFLVQNVERQSAEAEQSIEFLEEQAPELRSQLATAEDRLNAYRVEMDSVDLSSESRAVLEQYIELERRLSELEFQEAELSQRYTQSHPAYQALLRQKRHLEQERAELNERINTLPRAQQEVVRLTRDVEVTQAIYVNVLNKMQELQVARAGTIGNVRIIDQALVSGGPIQPKRPLIVALSTMLGGMLAVMFVFGRAMLNKGVETPEQLEEIGLPVYATVPLSEDQARLEQGSGKKGLTTREQDHVLALRSPTDTSVEALRGLRTSLHFAMLDATDNRLLVTGPSPAVGKSFIAVNLGAVCAQAGQRTLVIDADMRKGHIHNIFGGKAEGGLSDALSGKSKLEDLIRTTNQEGFSYLSRGSAPPNPSELLMHERFGELLEQASAQFDLVILDTPPVLAVTDAAIVGRQCGTTFMVARFQKNPVGELQVATKRLASAGVQVRGALLNAMERKASAYYGYYGYYNYTYK